MRSSRMFYLMAICAVFFIVVIYFAAKKRKQFEIMPPAEKVVIDTSNSASPSPASPGMASSPVALNTPMPAPTACHQQPEYSQLRQQLGHLVNSDGLRRQPTRFLKNILEFRKQYGLPFSLNTLPDNKLDSEGVVYNNCHPTCHGAVNQVFVSRLVQNRFVEVYTKSGKFEKLPLHDSGLDVATVDELNRQGVPYRSWRVPAMSSDWYISGNKLYYEMDIEGLWLQVDLQGNWKVVSKPKGLQQLTAVEPAVKVAGCVPDENCLQAGSGRHARYFKAPKACGSALKHETDEPVEPSGASGSGSPVPHPGPGSLPNTGP